MRRTNCTLIKFQMKFDNAKIVIIFQQICALRKERG